MNILGFRGLEVLENAESQFPNESKIVIEKLAELITNLVKSMRTLDGGKLLTLFRSIGLNALEWKQKSILNRMENLSLLTDDKLRDQSSDSNGE